MSIPLEIFEWCGVNQGFYMCMASRTFKNFIEQHSDTIQCNMRYNIKYNTENDEINRNSSKNTFYIL